MSICNHQSATRNKPRTTSVSNSLRLCWMIIWCAADTECEAFRGALVEAGGRFRVAVHTYVRMTNHAHFLVSLMRENSIRKTLQSVGLRYVRYFNRKHDRTGTLWKGRYRATLVETEHFF